MLVVLLELSCSSYYFLLALRMKKLYITFTDEIRASKVGYSNLSLSHKHKAYGLFFKPALLIQLAAPLHHASMHLEALKSNNSGLLIW